MPQKTSPFLEGKWGWNFGESGWNSGADENWLKFSYMFDANVNAIVSTLPAAVNGEAYFLTTDNRIYFVVDGTYYSTPVPKWFEFKIRSTGDIWQFNGVAVTSVESISTLSNRVDSVETSLDAAEVKLSTIVSVLDKPIINNDICTAIQATVNDLAAIGGGKCFIPPKPGGGDWTVIAGVDMRENVTVECLPGCSFETSLLASPANSTGLVRFKGDRSEGVAIAAEVTTGSTVITTVSPHNLAVGDLFYLLGQRNALSVDAGEDWRLGTQNSGPAYFAEFGIVQVVNSPTGITAAWGLTFPEYKPAGHTDTDPASRPSTTLHKVTPVKNSHWIGGKINSKRLNNNFFRGDWAYKCTFEAVEIDASTFKGGMTLWRNCFNCDTVRLVTTTDPATIMTDAEHDDWNHHKITSSQNCNIIDSVSNFSSQCWDISYFNGEGVNLFCDVIRFQSNGARFNAGTTHPGAYKTDVLDGKYLDCRESGLSIRSRGGNIRGNKLTGYDRLKSGEHGIAIYDGWARDNELTENDIYGFNSGLLVWDSSNAEGKFSRIDCRFIDNKVSNCVYGFRRTTSSTSPENINTADSGLIIHDNKFSKISNKFVEIGPYTRGFEVTRNQFVGPLSSGGTSNWVHILANATQGLISGNSFRRGVVGDVAIRLESTTDSIRFPAPVTQWASDINPNHFFQFAGTEFSSSIFNITVPDIWRLGRPGVIPMKDGVTAPTAIQGTVQVFTDVADGDTKILYGDNVLKTVMTDT